MTSDAHPPLDPTRHPTPSLPTEILREILHLTLSLYQGQPLEVQRARFAFGGVAKTWYLASQQEREFAVVGSDQADRLRNELERRLEERQVRGEEAEDGVEKLYFLTSSLDGAAAAEGVSGLLDLLGQSLQVLEIELAEEEEEENEAGWSSVLFSTMMDDQWKSLSKVHTLTILAPSPRVDPSDLRILKLLPNLFHLTLDLRLPSQNKATLPSLSPNLVHLCLTAPANWVTALLRHWFTPSNSLTSLFLNVAYWSPGDLSDLITPKLAGQLLEFTLNVRPMVRPPIGSLVGDMLAGFIRPMERVQKLSIIHHFGCTESELKALSALPSLQSINLNLFKLHERCVSDLKDFFTKSSNLRKAFIIPSRDWKEDQLLELNEVAEGLGIELEFGDRKVAESEDPYKAR